MLGIDSDSISLLINLPGKGDRCQQFASVSSAKDERDKNTMKQSLSFQSWASKAGGAGWRSTRDCGDDDDFVKNLVKESLSDFL